MTVEPTISDTVNQPALTLKRSLLTADGRPPGCCFPLAGIPHCHLFITSLSQSDSQYPVDRWASSEAALAISEFHKTVFPIHRRNIWAPQRKTAAARAGCHFSPRFHWGDKEMSDGPTTGAYESFGADKACHFCQGWDREETQTTLFPIFWEHFTPNKHNAKSTNLTVLKIQYRTSGSGSGKEYWLDNKGKWQKVKRLPLCVLSQPLIAHISSFRTFINTVKQNVVRIVCFQHTPALSKVLQVPLSLPTSSSMFLVDPKMFLGQISVQHAPPRWTCLEYPYKEVSRKNAKQMPEPPQLAAYSTQGTKGPLRAPHLVS